MNPPRIRPPAIDDNSFPIGGEVEVMGETDGAVHCWVGDLAAGCPQGSPLTSSRILALSQLRKVGVYFYSMVAITEYRVAGGYGLGSAIVEPKAANGCWERRRVRAIGEGQMDGMRKYAMYATIACRVELS